MGVLVTMLWVPELSTLDLAEGDARWAALRKGARPDPAAQSHARRRSQTMLLLRKVEAGGLGFPSSGYAGDLRADLSAASAESVVLRLVVRPCVSAKVQQRKRRCFGHMRPAWSGARKGTLHPARPASWCWLLLCAARALCRRCRRLQRRGRQPSKPVILGAHDRRRRALQSGT